MKSQGAAISATPLWSCGGARAGLGVFACVLPIVALVWLLTPCPISSEWREHVCFALVFGPTVMGALWLALRRREAQGSPAGA